jgi:hypothetical protein
MFVISSLEGWVSFCTHERLIHDHSFIYSTVIVLINREAHEIHLVHISSTKIVSPLRSRYPYRHTPVPWPLLRAVRDRVYGPQQFSAIYGRNFICREGIVSSSCKGSQSIFRDVVIRWANDAINTMGTDEQETADPSREHGNIHAQSGIRGRWINPGIVSTGNRRHQTVGASK